MTPVDYSVPVQRIKSLISERRSSGTVFGQIRSGVFRGDGSLSIQVQSKLW